MSKDKTNHRRKAKAKREFVPINPDDFKDIIKPKYPPKKHNGKKKPYKGKKPNNKQNQSKK